MTRVQIIEQNGTPAFAVVPFDIWQKVQGITEDVEDIALYDAAIKTDDGFRIPAEIVNRELDGEHPIKVWREYQGLTAEKVAKMAGISKAYLSQIENGKRCGTMKVTKAIAGVLNVPLDILYPDEEIKLAA